jgi:hypothetical protein
MSDQLKQQISVLNSKEIIEYKTYLMSKTFSVDTKPSEAKRLAKLIKEVDKFLN